MPRSVVIAFYGHTAESAKGATGKPEYQFLSNFSRCQFSLDGNTFYSTEQWLHWSKAHLFKDKMIANKILSLLNEDDLESDNTNWTNKNKKIKQTKFGKNDTNYFSPLCLTIGILTIILELIK